MRGIIQILTLLFLIFYCSIYEFKFYEKKIQTPRKEIHELQLMRLHRNLILRGGFGGGSFTIEEEENSEIVSSESSYIIISGSPSYLLKLNGIYTKTGIIFNA